MVRLLTELLAVGAVSTPDPSAAGRSNHRRKMVALGRFGPVHELPRSVERRNAGLSRAAGIPGATGHLS
jgi:hypothetical protein